MDLGHCVNGRCLLLCGVSTVMYVPIPYDPVAVEIIIELLKLGS